jgi:hypothetical protein
MNMPTENGGYPNYDPIGRGRFWQNRAFFEQQARQRGEVTRDPAARDSDPMRAATDPTLIWMLSLPVDEVRSPRTSDGRPWEIEHSGTQQQWGRALKAAGFSASDANRLTDAVEPSKLMDLTPLHHAFEDAYANRGGNRADIAGNRFLGTQAADDRQLRPLGRMSEDTLREIVRMIELNPTRYNFEQNDKTRELKVELQKEITQLGLSLPSRLNDGKAIIR